MEEIENLEESEVKEEKKDNEVKVNITKRVEVNEDDINYLTNAAKTMAINNGYIISNLTKKDWKKQIDFVANTDKPRFTEEVKRAALYKIIR